MKLSLIVTHYNEPRKDIENLFKSIAFQRMVPWSDIDIHIVEDGTVDVPEDLYRDLQCEVYHHHPGHQGVSGARNYGFDNSKGDYVMFCDCDDMFLNALGIHLVLCAIEESPELISSCFIEETKTIDTGEMRIVRHDNDLTFIHGKAYRRAFLKREGVRFDKDMAVHEDGYFNRLAFYLQKSKKYIETPFYLWCWRDNSVCRDDEFVLKTYPQLIRNRIALSEKLLSKGMDEAYKNSVLATFCLAYYDFMKPSWNKEQYGGYIVEARKAVRKFWRKYGDFIKTHCTKPDMAAAMRGCREQAYKEGMLYETMTIIQFVRVLEE